MRLLVSYNPQMVAQLEERLRREAPDVEVVRLDENGQPSGPVEDAEILLRMFMPEEVLQHALTAAPHLKWLHTVSAGVDRFIAIVRAQESPGLLFTNGSGTMSQPIAEFVLAQIFAAAKRLPNFVRAQERHEWRQRELPPARDVQGSRLLVLGLGNIGCAVARLAAGVGMRVWGTRRTPLAAGETIPGVERVFAENDDWREALPEIAYIAVCLPLTPATHHLIGAAELARLQPGAWIINIARGGLIDETALVAALTAGSLGGAALDVTEEEPLPRNHPLWDCPNAIITPHISWRSPQVNARMLDLFCENLRRYRAHEPLLNVVALDRGY